MFETIQTIARFEVERVTLIKTHSSGDVTACRLIDGYGHFEIELCPHLQD